jgi:hypothetical protein
MLAGHSFGGGTVLYYLQGRCPLPFCPPFDSVFVPSDKIKAAVVFATQRSVATQAMVPSIGTLD